MTQKGQRLISFLWQERIEASGLMELLGFAQQLKDSGLFDENELAPIRSELKEISVLLAKNLITHLSEDVPDMRPPVQVRERREKEFSKVRGRLKRFGKTLGNIG